MNLIDKQIKHLSDKVEGLRWENFYMHLWTQHENLFPNADKNPSNLRDLINTVEGARSPKTDIGKYYLDLLHKKIKELRIKNGC